MLTISVLLIPFALFVAGVIAYGVLTMWAVYRFGGDLSAFAATFLFWAGTATVLFFTWFALAGVDWNIPLLRFEDFTATGI
jgi:hypothetical protein